MAEGQQSKRGGQQAKEEAPKRVTVVLAKEHTHRGIVYPPDTELTVWDWQAERMRAHGEIKE
jgi:hypothetical protein